MAIQEEDAEKVRQELLEEGSVAGGEEAAEGGPAELPLTGLAAWLSIHAPWWGISLALHVLAILLVGVASWNVQEEEPQQELVVETRLERRPKLLPEEKVAQPRITQVLEPKPQERLEDPNAPPPENLVIPPGVVPEVGDHYEAPSPDQPDTGGVYGRPDGVVLSGEAGGGDGTPGPGGVAGPGTGGGGGFGDLSEQLIGVGPGATARSHGWGLGDGGGGGGGGLGLGPGAGKGGWGRRTQAGRKWMIRAGGGSPQTEWAVDWALKWLAENQESDGHWDAVKYGAGGKVDAGVTGMALMAFVGAGHTETVGPFKANIRKALDWIKNNQDASGKIGGSGYEHAICGLALAEFAGMAQVPSTISMAQKALDCSLKDYCNGVDGWRYHPKQAPGDLSVTGWFIMQLKSAKMAGLRMEPGAYDNAMKYVDKYEVKDAFGPGASGYTYQGDRGAAPTTTAIGCLCRLFAGVKPAEIKGSVEGFVERGGVPNWERANLYYWYYGALCTYQQGGETWKKWNEAMKKALCDNQEKEASNKGSWPVQGNWSERYGRVGQTAFAALCLEVYYRYTPMFR